MTRTQTYDILDAGPRNRFIAVALRFWTYPLYGKTLCWKRNVRIFCDAGQPIFRWAPHFRRQHYARHWGLWGFAAYLWGREINFSFGEDKKGLYAERGVTP